MIPSRDKLLRTSMPVAFSPLSDVQPLCFNTGFIIDCPLYYIKHLIFCQCNSDCINCIHTMGLLLCMKKTVKQIHNMVALFTINSGESDKMKPTAIVPHVYDHAVYHPTIRKCPHGTLGATQTALLNEWVAHSTLLKEWADIMYVLSYKYSPTSMYLQLVEMTHTQMKSGSIYGIAGLGVQPALLEASCRPLPSHYCQIYCSLRQGSLGMH